MAWQLTRCIGFAEIDDLLLGLKQIGVGKLYSDSHRVRVGSLGSQGGLVVTNPASHLCDPISTLASGRIWAEFQSIST